MATEKFQTLSALSLEELQTELQNTEKAYGKLTFDHAIKGLENPLMVRETRRDVARLKTEIRRREILEMDDATKAKRRRLIARRKKN